MNNYPISHLLHNLISLSDIIFTGLKVLVPLIYSSFLIRINYFNISKLKLIVSVNMLLLTGGILFLTSFLTDTLLSLRTANEFDLNFIMTIIAGPHWYQIIVPILNYAILPQLLWFKKLRHSINISFAIVLFWIISGNIIRYLASLENANFSNHQSSFSNTLIEYIWKVLIDLFIIAFIYLFLLNKSQAKSAK